MEEIELDKMAGVEKHPFEHQKRIAASELSELECDVWSPPVINEAGHLIYAQPRPAPRRDSSADADDGAAQSPEEALQGYDDGFKQGKEEGLLAGKEVGIQQGKQEAIQLGQQELQPKLAEINLLLTSLSHSVNEEDYKLEQTLMHLVKHIAEAVIRHEIRLDPGQLMKVIKETIAALPPNRDNVKIMVSPSDKKLVDEAINAGGENWRAVSDEELNPGDIKIETDQSVADYSVENRIQTVLDQLYEQQAICPKPGDPGYEAAPDPSVLAKAESKTLTQESSSAKSEVKADEINEQSEIEGEPEEINLDELPLPPSTNDAKSEKQTPRPG